MCCSDRYWVSVVATPTSLAYPSRAPQQGPCTIRGTHRVVLDPVVVGRYPVRRAHGLSEAAPEAGGEQDLHRGLAVARAGDRRGQGFPVPEGGVRSLQADSLSFL